MSLSDIFTPSVVISLAISVLLIGLFGLYVNNKLNEQNHKLNTMFDLVSTLANELQMVRSQPVGGGMGSAAMGGGGGRVYEKPEVANTNHLVNMIDVSDDSESSGGESDGETDEGAESDNDSGSDDDGDEGAGDGEDESGSDGDDEESDGDSDDDVDGKSDARSDKAIIVSESLDDALFEELANLDDIVFEETSVERVKTPETIPIQTNTSNVKNLNVVFDYKKASLSKLREIVEQKGLSSDTSKLKKQELLKLLEID
jgi:cobalamin biosynthesis protein CobT